MAEDVTVDKFNTVKVKKRLLNQVKNDRCLEFEDSRGPAKQLSCTSTDLVLQPNQFYE